MRKLPEDILEIDECDKEEKKGQTKNKTNYLFK